MQKLLVVDPSRTEYGLDRTACSCEVCVRNCRFMPGYLSPIDLDRFRRKAEEQGIGLETWARENLLASPGAMASRKGKVFRIPTLVPARKPDLSCKFLTDNRCSIWQDAPFGCAFFDCSARSEQREQANLTVLEQILRDCAAEGLYFRTWLKLYADDRVAPKPEECRRLMGERL